MIEFVKNFWCQKVLPLVYTDALSYYEVLSKFVSKLNEIVNNVNNLNENTVFTVNNVKPVDGNVTIDASSFEGFVSGVNGKKPDAGGEVTLTAADVGAVPDSKVIVSSVNGIEPTEGNVNVGTVKSVNGSMPDESGNVNLPQVSGVTSVDGVGADSNGNVPLNAVKTVNGIAPADGNVNVGTVKSVNGIMPTNGNVNVGTVRTVNGKAPDLNGAVDGVTVESLYPYVENWANFGDMYNFARNTAHIGKLYYCSVYHENDYQWWDTNKFGMGSFILTIMNVDANVAPLIELRSLARGDIFILDRWGNDGNYTYPWFANYGANIKTINNIAPDDKGNINITANNVGAIANTDGSVYTNLIADKNVTRAKVADEITYIPEVSVDSSSTRYITKNMGGLFNWVYGTGYNLELDSAEYNKLETFWETILYNSEAGNLTIKFTGLANVFDTRTGETLGGTSQITVTKYKAVKLKKIGTSGIVVLSA